MIAQRSLPSLDIQIYKMSAMSLTPQTEISAQLNHQIISLLDFRIPQFDIYHAFLTSCLFMCYRHVLFSVYGNGEGRSGPFTEAKWRFRSGFGNHGIG